MTMKLISNQHRFDDFDDSISLSFLTGKLLKSGITSERYQQLMRLNDEIEPNKDDLIPVRELVR